MYKNVNINVDIDTDGVREVVNKLRALYENMESSGGTMFVTKIDKDVVYDTWWFLKDLLYRIEREN